MRTLAAGALVAGAIAGFLLAVVFGGENGWKVALAAVGLVLWVLGGLSKNPDPGVSSDGQKRRS
jgi:uncharacterized membrane protein YoaK (UPF0700 family)